MIKPILAGALLTGLLAGACGGGDGGGGACSPALAEEILEVIRGATTWTTFAVECEEFGEGGGIVYVDYCPQGMTCSLNSEGGETGPVSGTIDITVSVSLPPGTYEGVLAAYRYAVPGEPLLSSFAIEVQDCAAGTDCPDFEVCNNGGDDDGDEISDCADPDCAAICVGRPDEEHPS